ncbi:MAG TPA: hypothetical protein IAB60_04975 [Candidatus Caccovicinus merdipullorum]|uniref:Camelysin metallo-endopeptidase n=1 Tax=Candidatus Caccovicinus merdipullorum TaxID=2840724 RepID=A0A9D1GJS9_9FIRM|nr:hypothetical protein [Candidatus Caccovicinus merdipullorum]
MKIERKEKKLSAKPLILAAAAALLSFGITWAYYSDIIVLANPFATGHSGAAMVEEFNPDSSFLPGETVIKKVAFQNTGEMDIFLRVEVPPEEAWYAKGESEPLDEPYTTETVIKNWKDGIWPEGGDTVSTADWSQVFTDADGTKYRYYRRILSAGETTEDILDSIKLSTEVSNDRHDIDYSDKIYKLTFNAEAVPVEELNGELSVQSQWNMDVTEGEGGILTWSERIGGNE